MCNSTCSQSGVASVRIPNRRAQRDECDSHLSLLTTQTFTVSLSIRVLFTFIEEILII